MENTLYANRQKANELANEAYNHYKESLQKRNNAQVAFYDSLASTIRANAKGADNAKPAMYFARLMSDVPSEQHGIATTIGVCGAVADDDMNAFRLGQLDDTSKGYTYSCLGGLRRKTEDKVIHWAEVDENGNVIGKIRERSERIYTYYWNY